MTSSAEPVIVGVEPHRAEHADAVALGAALARAAAAPLLLVSVYEPGHLAGEHDGSARTFALRRAVQGLGAHLQGLEVEQLVLPGASAARVLHALADMRRPRALAVGSSPKAPWGHVELGHVSQRLLHGGAAPTAVAPRGYASRVAQIRTITVGYAGTPESRDALGMAAALAGRIGARLRVVTVFDPADFIHHVTDAGGGADLRERARAELDRAVAALAGGQPAGELIDGDPAETLARMSLDCELLVVGSRSYGPLRAVLLGGVSGELAHRSGCALMVVPHVPDPEHEVTLVGGLEARS